MKTIFIFAMVIAIFLGCGEDEMTQFSKDEMGEYAKEQASDIVYDHYTKAFKTLDNVTVSNMNYWFESDITLHVSCVVFYTIDFQSDLLGERRLQKQYTLTFQVNDEADTIEQSARFVSVSPALQLTLSDIIG